MNREDVMRMAAEAGVSPINDQQIKFEGPMWLCLDRFAALVAAAEREACCKIVYGQCESDNVAQRTVDAIRARGET